MNRTTSCKLICDHRFRPRFETTGILSGWNAAIFLGLDQGVAPDCGPAPICNSRERRQNRASGSPPPVPSDPPTADSHGNSPADEFSKRELIRNYPNRTSHWFPRLFRGSEPGSGYLFRAGFRIATLANLKRLNFVTVRRLAKKSEPSRRQAAPPGSDKRMAQAGTRLGA